MTQPDADSRFARDAWIRALTRTADLEADPLFTLPVLVEELARREATAPALASPGNCLSYGDLAARAARYSRWGLARGLGGGGVAALVLGNCADYVAVWLGLTRIGAAVALINTQISGAALAHSLAAVAPRLVIAGAEHAPALASAARAYSSHPLALWVLGEDGTRARRSAAAGAGERRAAGARESGAAGAGESGAVGIPLEPELRKLEGGPLDPHSFVAPTLDSTALYIYTSGTTGLPKAAKVSHYRVMRWSQWFAGLLDVSPSDRLYDCLPLYHSVGGVVAVGAALAGGASVVIRPKFSASEFWRDVSEERCTLFQYIGELCRYLVNAPEHPLERAHSLRIACGNGLRPEVWQPFKTRFSIPRIVEYYASTEGNFSLYNCEGRPGSIGRIPRHLAHRLPVALVRFDAGAEEPARNERGLCERVGTGEVGEAIGLMSEEARGARFEGYADAEATRRKVLRDVFRAGDAWYRTGDLMRQDAEGFYYFVDRIGETFRWKGENVSTAEVSSALCEIPGVRDGVVFGVEIPGTDGRAGMAALIVDPAFDLAAFRAAVQARLPRYARPVFVRLIAALEVTGTFKPRKQELAAAGFNPARTGDALYADAPDAGAYIPLDKALYAEIVAGRVRL
jgi:fatty-acyl-CoA synthase